MHKFKTFDPGVSSFGDVTVALRGQLRSGCWGERPSVEAPSPSADDVVSALRELPATATLRDVVAVVLGERPGGHGQTYANVVITHRALGRLAELVAGREFAPWEPAA
jgi:hypothetical protein